MANISKDTFNAANGYQKVIFTQQGALLDFDFNEAQDIIRERVQAVVSQLADGVSVLGSAGRVTPAVSALARMVDVAAGVAFNGGVVVRIPATTNLQVFDNATTSGSASSLVYVEWWDAEVDYTGDANLKPTDTGLGNGHARLKRTVQVKANVGSTALPTPVAGHNVFALATVTHNFTTNGTVVLASDVAQSPYGVTPGELAGYGAARTLRLVSNGPANGVAHERDTRATYTSGKLLSLKNAGVEKAFLDFAGALTLLGGLTATTGTFSSNVSITGNLTISGTVDGVDVSAHAHDGTTVGGPKVAHANLTGLAVGDDHAQYVHISTARTVSAVHTLNPAVAGAPFLLGANAQGQLVVGLNADKLDGYDGSQLAALAEAETVTGSWTFNANVLAPAGVTFDGVDLSAVKDGSTGIDHAKLTGLTGTDHHTQYVHISTARTIAAVHTFNPAVAGAPFLLGANASGQLVTGLNAERLGGQTLANLDARYLALAGGTVTGVTSFSAQTNVKGDLSLFLTGDTQARLYIRSSDGSLAWGQGGSTTQDTTLARSGASALTLTGHLSVTGRLRSPGNFLDSATANAAISATGSIPVANVGKRALVVRLNVDPGAYSGNYDVYVYADNNTTSTSLAKWQGQTGVLTDPIPWHFRNDRSDETLYVQVVKATTGTAHTFTVTLSAERFA